MHSDRVEKLRLEYTDQYVAVDDSRPELARFRGKVGQVRTINVNGRALVEFDGSRSRHDLELDYLKVVDKPKPKAPPAKAKAAKPPEKKPVEEKPQPKEKLSELELARQKKDATKPDRTVSPADKADEKAKKDRFGAR